MIISNNINNDRKTKIIKKTEPAFKGAGSNIALKVADAFIKSQENLSSTRFIQDSATNWAPKAVFSRSKEDFAEMSFLEFLESGIFYFSLPLLGEKLYRNKLFKKITPPDIREKVNEQIPRKLGKITADKKISDEVKKRATGTKAGILLACAAIPVAEYTLSFAKNLFTLKTFNKSNFSNIANLDKTGEEAEDKEQQKTVEEHAKRQFKKAGLISALGIASGVLLALNSHKSDKLQKAAKAIIDPGEAVSDFLIKKGLKEGKITNNLKKFSLDFAEENGKLALGKGQLALTAVTGLFGYSKAAQDRGRLDVAEVWTRVPLVVFYTIFGGELFEKGFSKILEKKNKFPDIIQKSKDGKLLTPKRNELPELAQKISKTRKTDYAKELARLTKEKAFVTGVPYIFSLLFMGITLSAITRVWTQYRYNHNEKKSNGDIFKYIDNEQKSPDVFKEFKNR